MKENVNFWSKITSQWLNFWIDSSALTWRNWLILMDAKSTIDPIHSEQLSQLSSYRMDDLLQKLVRLTQESQKNQIGKSYRNYG